MPAVTLPTLRSLPHKGSRFIEEPLGEEAVLGAFLGLLDKDIEEGRNLHEISDSMAAEMREFLDEPVDMDEEIEGPVALG